LDSTIDESSLLALIFRLAPAWTERNIIRVEVVRDGITRRSKHYAFVELPYDSDMILLMSEMRSSASKAIGTDLDCCRVVSRAEFFSSTTMTSMTTTTIDDKVDKKRRQSSTTIASSFPMLPDAAAENAPCVIVLERLLVFDRVRGGDDDFEPMYLRHNAAKRRAIELNSQI